MIEVNIFFDTTNIVIMHISIRRVDRISRLPLLNGYHSAAGTEVIKNKKLLPDGGYINGQFTFGSAKPNDTFEVINPANGSVIHRLPRMGVEDTVAGIKAASDAWKTWKETTVYDRARVLEKISELMNLYKDDLAAIITLEAGKPMAEAKGEIVYAVSFVDYYAEEAKRIKGDTLPSPVKIRRLVTIKQPVGPCGLITPWNFPSAMITRKLAPALAAGCTAVLKPAGETPLSALAICAILEEAGVPAGVVNCVTVDRTHVEEVGRTLCHSKDIRKISFTGSTPVGKWLMREAASTVKKVSILSNSYIITGS